MIGSHSRCAELKARICQDRDLSAKIDLQRRLRLWTRFDRHALPASPSPTLSSRADQCLNPLLDLRSRPSHRLWSRKHWIRSAVGLGQSSRPLEGALAEQSCTSKCL